MTNWPATLREQASFLAVTLYNWYFNKVIFNYPHTSLP